MDMDEFYQDYLTQRIVIARIKQMRGDETVSSLLRDLEEEAKEIGIQIPSKTKLGNKDAINWGNHSIIKDKNILYNYEDLIQKAAKLHWLPPELIKAVIKVESDFYCDAVSSKGAQGLMQLMPETAENLGISNPFDPEANILGGTWLLKRHLSEFGSLKKALIAFNAGPEIVKENKNIPEETRKYIRKVIYYYQIYKGSH